MNVLNPITSHLTHPNQMTTITKQQVEELIERLASKELTFGCLILNEVGQKEYIIRALYSDLKGYWKIKTDGTAIEWRYEEGNLENEITILGHPILIGDVLEKILQTDDDCGGLETEEDVKECMALWYDCGLTKSLQESAGRIVYEEEQFHNHGDEACDEGCAPFEIAKPSPEADLLLFIHNLEP